MGGHCQRHQERELSQSPVTELTSGVEEILVDEAALQARVAELGA